MGYDINDIQHWETREAMRNRIQTYLGSDDTNGIYQSLKEIINNSTDEALAGYGDKIEINIDESTNKITVRDYGRGVPFGKDAKGKEVLVSIYTESHTGGKFNKNAYKNSSGLNGLGGTACNMSSDKFTVVSVRDGVAATASFEKGILKEYKETKTKEPNGTTVTFIPDKEVFKNMTEGYSYDKICEDVKNISYLNNNVHFIVTCGKKKKEFYSEHGLVDFIKEQGAKPLMKPIFAAAQDENDEVEIAFMWTNGPEKSFVFVNGLMCPDGGSPITGAKTTLTQMVKKLSGKEFESDLIRHGLVYVINCKVLEPSFSNQTKNKINNPNLRTLASAAFKDGLTSFAKSGDFDSVMKILSQLQRAENAANKARTAALNGAKEIEKNAAKKVFNTDKLKDAEKLGKDAILLICEGDSAAATMVKARDYKKYGVLAIRGKMINSLSNADEKVYANEEIKLLLKAMNIVPGKYDAKKLRYGKIGICVDADSDGAHIALLIMANLYTLAPEFLNENRLCWLRSPLWIVKNGKTESYYFTDEEMNAARRTVKGTIQRNKGLGSLDAKQAHNSMFTPEFQRLDIITPNEEGINLLLELMGDEVEPRREFIFNNIDFSTIRE